MRATWGLRHGITDLPLLWHSRSDHCLTRMLKEIKNSPNRGRAITSVMGKFLILHISSQVLAFNTDPQLLFPRIPGARQEGKFIAMILQLEELRHRPVITEPLETRVPWIEAENRVWSIPLCEQNSSHFADKDQGLWSPMPQIY